jgi:hypothetical protein
LSLVIGIWILSVVNDAIWISHKKNNQKNNKQNIELVFSKSQWEQCTKLGAKEILIQGKMFDVYSTFVTDFQVIVKGHFDTKEDLLIAKYKSDQEKKITKHCFSCFFYHEEISCYQLPFVEQVQNTFHNLKETKNVSNTFDIEIPPPNA